MKYSLVLIFLFTLSNLIGQTIENASITSPKSNKLMIAAKYGDVVLRTWDKQSIEVVSNAQIDRGREDHRYSLEVVNRSSGIEILSVVDIKGMEQSVIALTDEGEEIVLPGKQYNTNDNYGDSGYKSVNVSYDIQLEVVINVPEGMFVNTDMRYGDIDIDGKFKDLNVYSKYGKIEAKITDVNAMDKLSLDATYDLVDLTIDKNSNAVFNVKNQHGEMLSDLPLKFAGNLKKKRSCSSSCKGDYTLNDGTVPINLRAPYDNIYLRSFESRREYELKKL